jgi:hypothetical protein
MWLVKTRICSATAAFSSSASQNMIFYLNLRKVQEQTKQHHEATLSCESLPFSPASCIQNGKVQHVEDPLAALILPIMSAALHPHGAS